MMSSNRDLALSDLPNIARLIEFPDNSYPSEPSFDLEDKLCTFLRIRPFDSCSNESIPYEVINSTTFKVDCQENNINIYGSVRKAKSNKKIYTFTEIFTTQSTQCSVFLRSCQPLLRDLIQGINGMLFCFGTSSSGKSFTMRGPHEDPKQNPGLIPKSLQYLFSVRKFNATSTLKKTKFCDLEHLSLEEEIIENNFKQSILANSSCENISYPPMTGTTEFNEDGFQYVCYISFFEIYNGFVFDLLQHGNNRVNPLTLMNDSQSRYYVNGLKSVLVSSLSEATKIYSFGWNNLQRNIKQTGVNENSSRSHSFFTISVIKYSDQEGQMVDPKVSHLTLGDLAGSERQNKTDSSGVRVREGGNINLSLLHLKDVFTQVKMNQRDSSRNHVVPYRNCSLTKVFQPYLTGVGRVWMIANVNPSPALIAETKGTLEFTSTASTISIIPRCQSDTELGTLSFSKSSEIIRLEAQVHDLTTRNEKEIEELKREHNLAKREIEMLTSEVMELTAQKENLQKENENQGKEIEELKRAQILIIRENEMLTSELKEFRCTLDHRLEESNTSKLELARNSSFHNLTEQGNRTIIIEDSFDTPLSPSPSSPKPLPLPSSTPVTLPPPHFLRVEMDDILKNQRIPTSEMDNQGKSREELEKELEETKSQIRTYQSIIANVNRMTKNPESIGENLEVPVKKSRKSRAAQPKVTKTPKQVKTPRPKTPGRKPLGSRKSEHFNIDYMRKYLETERAPESPFIKGKYKLRRTTFKLVNE